MNRNLARRRFDVAFPQPAGAVAAAAGSYIGRRLLNSIRNRDPIFNESGSVRDWERKIKRRKRMTNNARSSTGSGGQYASKSLSSSRVYLSRKRRSKKKRKMSRVPRGIKKYVNKRISSQAGKALGKLYDYRHNQTQSVASQSNQCAYLSFCFGSDGDMATLASNYGKQLNAASATETVDYDAGINLSLKGSMYQKLEFRNNSSFGCKVRVYFIVPKSDTGVGPETSITDGLDDFALANTGLELNTMYYPSDSKLFKSTYKVVKSFSIELEPGASGQCSANRKLWWNSAHEASHGLAYQKGTTMCALVRLEGVISHSQASAATIGIGQATLDTMMTTRVKLRGVGSSPGAYNHTGTSTNLDTMTAPTQFQASDPGEEVYAI